ncbi:nuclear transport factor 2 family protein [Mangrovimonas aestuarii]|uniref:nuclear transport factor 2 family protein n=1 Tax=Mangrovimonas aestuarii TaxID=3018443 RepID=UPI00237912F6|nr:nuclear transport factor 2 family protein [Mangrovimonas aestuarii]
MAPKDIVKQFYQTDFSKCIEEISDFLHDDCKLHWSSSTGFKIMEKKDIKSFFSSISRGYEGVRFQISHLLQDGNFVTTRYTLYANLIEDREDEKPIAHFITIWELKDGKLYQGHEISQLADESMSSILSFSEIKV